MRFSSILALVGFTALSQAAIEKRDYDANDFYVLQLRGVNPEVVATRLGLEHRGTLGSLDDHHIFRAPLSEDDVVGDHLKKRKLTKRSQGGVDDVLDNILYAEKQKRREGHLQKRMVPRREGPFDTRGGALQENEEAIKKQDSVIHDLHISDPIFRNQWHLLNTIQPGHDINVTPVWKQGITGHNVTVAVIDDGLDFESRDLKDNYFAKGSYDFNRHQPHPRPQGTRDKHGTRCAGEISAGRNDICGLGVAYEARIAGLQMLSGPLTNADEAEAVMYENQENEIYSCSWGPSDDGKTMEAPSILIKRAMVKSIQEGRDKKGSIYVFASGNGAGHGDNCNFDGYTNSIYSITVGAVDREGHHPYYSELCSATLIVAYSSGAGAHIHTTDVGEDQCTNHHGGTSAAAPLAAGVFALVLQTRPDLTWRDMQYLALNAAQPIHPIDNEQYEVQTTAIGKKFSHTFAYGKLDAEKIVALAKDWKLVKPQAWFFSPWQHVKQDLPQGDEGLVVSFEVTKDMLKDANLERVEHVTVTMNVEHTRRGDLSVDLISPHGVVSHIAVTRERDEARAGYKDWTFMSVAHWGESGVGKWTLILRDSIVNDDTGHFVDWHLKLWGEAIDAKKQKLLPLPEATDDDDHDKIIETAKVSTATGLPPATATEHKTVPTDHIQRPTKPGADNTKPTATTSSTPESATTSPSSWISWLPNFGASKTAQIWIYGAIGLILVFCCGLGAYFIARRRRLQGDSRNYEFTELNDQETEGLTEDDAEKARRARRTRGGELYDAFAGESDEEDNFERYTDRTQNQQAGSSSERLP
ncbi:unnamed protein product, partial [Clonostachys rosea]